MKSHSDITLDIDLGAIKHNYQLLATMATGARTSAVVKADAYGLGVDKVAPALYASGCRDFFVATLDEGLQLSQILNADAKIYIFHGVKKGEQNDFFDRNLIPVINDHYQLEVWSHKAQQEGLKLPAILHFDTGMNRLGFNFAEAHNVNTSPHMKNIDIRYIMTHMAAISDESHPLNAQQIERMYAVKKYFPDIAITLANSRAIAAGKKYHFNMVRPGCSLYGIKGTAHDLDLKNVATAKGKIIQIRNIEEDGFVGYDATHAIAKGSRIAVVPCGYADGYLRSLSGRAYGTHKHGIIPLIGRVSMDMVIFDVSKIAEGKVNVGDEVELFGHNFSVDDIAEKAGTIGYEILTSLGGRYKRNYI